MSRKLTDEEKKLWQIITKTIKKLELDTPTKPQVSSDTKPTEKKKPRVKERAYTPHRVEAPTINSQPAAKIISRARKVKIEATIDLHGDTRSEAEPRLHRFLENAQRQGKVWVLVITGKGSINQEGVLKQNVPKWLDNWPFVASYTMAKIKDGGHGALYVRLKRA